MASQDFKARLERLNAKAAAAPPPPAAKKGSRRSASAPSFRGAIWGAVASGVVMTLFYSIESISALAPASVREGDTPGLFGAPIAIVSILWIAGIPLWFVGSVILNALRGRTPIPSGFVTGAFVVLAIAILLMRLLGMGSNA